MLYGALWTDGTKLVRILLDHLFLLIFERPLSPITRLELGGLHHFVRLRRP